MPVVIGGLPAEASDYTHPLNVFELVAGELEIEHERLGSDELEFRIVGAHGTYYAALQWGESFQTLLLSCPFYLDVPRHRDAEVKKLIVLINSMMWLGHYEFSDTKDDQCLLYRYGLFLPDDTEISFAQCKMLTELAQAAYDYYFDAFQFVIWAGKSAQEAIEYVHFETQGEA